MADPNTAEGWTSAVQHETTADLGRIWADKTVSTGDIEFEGDAALGKTSVAKSNGADFLVELSALSSTSSLTKPEPQPVDIVLVLDTSGSMAWDFDGRVSRIRALKDAVNTFIRSAESENAKITAADKKINISLVEFADKAEILQDLTTCEGANARRLEGYVNGLQAGGATAADYGIEKAQDVLNGSSRANAKKVVIFFTDGEPNHYSGYDAEVADSAINTAKGLKANGTTIYTVGIFKGAKTENPPANPANDTERANRFMHAVSSNYPNAASSWVDGTWEGFRYEPGHYDVTMGDRVENSAYYKKASDASELNTVFNDIFKDATSAPAVPTKVEGENFTADGYVTFTDTLGDYMTVAGFNAIAFGDEVYKDCTKTGNTYTFSGVHDGNIANQDKVTLDKILITVTPGENAAGDTVEVKIPAALLPLDYFNVKTDKDGKETSMEIEKASPIRVFYSVALKQDIKNQLVDGTVGDKLAAYIAANVDENGKINFYSNAYTKDEARGNTTATFTPSTNNSYYYFTEDTSLYTDDTCSTPATEINAGDTYYYKQVIYKQSGATTTAVPVKMDSANALKNDGADHYYIIPANTPKDSVSKELNDQHVAKVPNDTATATNRTDYAWDDGSTTGTLYLGNNGKIGYNATGSLRITKKVDSEYNDDDTFTIEVKLTGANGSYPYTTNTASGNLNFAGGSATLTLKKGQTATITGLPAGCKYTVSEMNIPAGYTAAYENETGTIVAGETKATTVTNTFKVESTTATLDVTKILSGRAWKEGDTFSFTLAAEDGTPMPAEGGETATVTYEGGAADANSRQASFGAITYEKPGNYTYTISEIATKLPGFDTVPADVTATVDVVRNGNQLTASVSYSRGTAGSAEFTNVYTAKLPGDAAFDLTAGKTLTGRAMKDKEFTFQLKDANDNVVSEAYNDSEGNIAFKDVTLNLADTQAAYIALLSAKTDDSEQSTPETAVAAYSLDESNETDEKVQDLLKRKYTLYEVAGTSGGVTYDQKVYYVLVELEDKGDGTLGIKEGGIKVYADAGYTQEVNLEDVKFENTYTPANAQLTLNATKTLTGRDLKDREFTFKLLENGNEVKTAQNDANGTINFELEYDQVGKHTYTMVEETGNKDTITYDETQYTFTVEVTDDGNGNLIATARDLPETVEFKNIYTPKPTEEVVLSGSKVLNGRTMQAGEFTFELCSTDGENVNVIDTADNDANGTFTFASLKYDKAGTYTYLVREKDTGVARVTYDKTQYTVTVKVTDQNGQLVAEVAQPENGLTFTNTYTPEPTPTPTPTQKPSTTPAPTQKPTATAAPKATAAPTPAPVIPQTADTFPLVLLAGLLVISGCALGVLVLANRKRGKK